jgi:hypothetical protein
MAFSTIWMAVASLIAAFDITKAVDENGKVIEPSQELVSALVVYVYDTKYMDKIADSSIHSMPAPYKYSIKPRSQQAEAMIHATANLEY